jgi:hypothetical protein
VAATVVVVAVAATAVAATAVAEEEAAVAAEPRHPTTLQPSGGRVSSRPGRFDSGGGAAGRTALVPSGAAR